MTCQQRDRTEVSTHQRQILFISLHPHFIDRLHFMIKPPHPKSMSTLSPPSHISLHKKEEVEK